MKLILGRLGNKYCENNFPILSILTTGIIRRKKYLGPEG
jgi:hypothetical protein